MHRTITLAFTTLLTFLTIARAADDAFKPTAEMIDVSHGWGVPFGGIGTGYSMFGKYGFLRVNFDGPPDNYRYGADPESRGDFVSEPSGKQRAPFGFLLVEGSRSIVFTERSGEWQPGVETFDRIKSYAHVPKGYFVLEKSGLGLDITITAFAPLLPHDLKSSTVPVQVYDVTIENTSGRTRELRLRLEHARDMERVAADIAVLRDARGHLAFAADGGAADTRGVEVALALQSGERKVSRFYLAWHYPSFRTPSPAARQTYTRYYADAFPNAASVAVHARKHADEWSKRIDDWHASYDVPPEFKRLWFGSLASVITSSMLSTDPYFFEVETPHQWINTMDVLAYSNWAYLVNWPELERMDMDMFFQSIPTEGERAGFVWHSLWDDASDYAEEPTFLARLYRDYLWFNDPQWLARGFPHAVRAANRVYKADHFEHLIESKHGNQSYDLWKMPGTSAYVNVAWVYGLYALERMSAVVDQPALVDGVSPTEMRTRAAASLDKLLWNDELKYWNLFYRTPGASEGNTPESALTDQLFGRWMLLIDPHCEGVLSDEKVKVALQTLYKDNLIEDRDQGFRGWVNGILPGRKTDPGGPHARTFWICAQLDLGSLLGASGDEAAALDVFRSVETSLKNNHLAVGEWNKSVDENLRVITLPNEPAKDTPRFPPYPRFKCSWEYLVRILGFKADEQYVYLDPFKTIDFRLSDIELAGMRLNVAVESGWKTARVDGEPVSGAVRLDRKTKEHRVEFLRDAPATAPAAPATTQSARIEIHGKFVTMDLTDAPDLKEWAEAKLLPVCEEWYPKIVAMLPSDGFTAREHFTVRFRDGMGGTPASTSGGRISCNTEWFRRQLDREAVGAVVHEMVHVVQAYGRARRDNPEAARNPGWMVEGVADYIRWFLFEPEKRGAEVRNPARAKYDGSYRVTANFINWVTDTYDKDLVRKMNAAMREGRYREELWKEYTGKTVAELGAEWTAQIAARRGGAAATTRSN